MAGTPTITVTPVPDGARRRTQQSTLLLHDWVTNVHPNAYSKYEMRLGPNPLSAPGVPLTPQVVAMLRRSNLYADLVFIENGAIGVVEAKVVGQAGAVSQLQAYHRLILTTPELQPYLNKPVTAYQLWAVDNPIAHELASQAGQVVIIYSPPWIQNYLSQVYYKSGAETESG